MPEFNHIPVLLDDVLRTLLPDGAVGAASAAQSEAPIDGRLKPPLRGAPVVVDCTLGLAGHSAELLKRIGPEGLLIGIDLDPTNLECARERLQSVGGRFILHHTNFAGLPSVLAQSGVTHADAVLADLGVSSPQIDDPARGFSYRQDGPLDMRMDPTRGKPASELLARISEKDLLEALLELGDEDDAPKIVPLILQRRAEQPIATTAQLTAIVCEARNFTLKRAAGAKLHPAARTFQALRMLVNREIANLQRLLDVLPQCLAPGGVAAIISFHSGEDRLVKKRFRLGLEQGDYSEIAPDPIVATDEESRANPRARSAKLRWAKK